MKKQNFVCRKHKNHYFSKSGGTNAPPAPQMTSLIPPNWPVGFTDVDELVKTKIDVGINTITKS